MMGIVIEDTEIDYDPAYDRFIEIKDPRIAIYCLCHRAGKTEKQVSVEMGHNAKWLYGSVSMDKVFAVAKHLGYPVYCEVGEL